MKIFKTRVVVVATYFPRTRLCLLIQDYDLVKDALKDTIRSNFNEEYIKNNVRALIRERGGEPYEIEGIFIKRWWQIWKKYERV